MDLTLSDFDNVEVGSLFLQNTETILIYGGAKDSPNISQIRFDRDMSQSLFSLVEHKDWKFNDKIGRSTAIASNIWSTGDPKQLKVLILSNSIGGSLWQMYLDPKDPTQGNTQFETSKFGDWDGQKLYVTKDYAIQYASRAKEPFG